MSNKAGTSPLPTTATFAAVFRTSVKNEDMDPDLLAANQVAALKLVRDAAGEAAKVVPRVYAWSTTVHGREPWSLMEFKEGVPLSSVWDDYSHTEKVALMPSLATLLASLQSTPLPSAPLPIGSFGFEDATDLDSPVTIVESQFHYGGPYATPRDLYRGIILSQWEALRNKAPRLEGWRGWSFECHEGNLNVLVDPATKEITAILDFEFSQCGPFHDEYFQGLIDYSLLQEGTRTHDATPAALALQPFSLHPTPTDAPDSLDGGAKDDFLIGQALALSLHAAGAKGPWTQPDSFESYKATTMPAATSALPVTLGLMTWGEEGTSGARVTDVKECEKMLDIFLSHGHYEVDTAYSYTNHTSEQYLGKIDYKSRGVVVDTKLYPFKNAKDPEKNITHSRGDLRKFINIQLKALNAPSMDMFYLHAPDRSVPFEETFAAVDELYKEGLFKRFGISNYQSWEVAHIVGLCDKNGWIKPTAYQANNAVHRNVEPELFPCLRALGISFYEFNPLGGGFFTGQYSKDAKVEEGSRFDPAKGQGQNYRSRYWKDEYFEALEMVKPVADAHKLTLAEVALRWVSHHSLMSREKGDNVLIGASSNAHLEQNLIDLEKGPLPEDVVKALDQAWEHVRPVASKYWH
ncbi:hypothetical protein RQP46_004210 [Phenoliferia psychrophenolica]